MLPSPFWLLGGCRGIAGFGSGGRERMRKREEAMATWSGSTENQRKDAKEEVKGRGR
jgi:hypothetical protein